MLKMNSPLTRAFTSDLTRQPIQYSLTTSLTIVQRIFFSITVITILSLSIIGNIAMFFMALRSDKIRPLYRTCLISLACSDLIGTILTGTNLLTQFFDKFNSIWHFGSAMCRILPFLITTALLVNNITLVIIALDRYLAVRQLIRNAWEPGGRCCLVIALIVWGISAAIACPCIFGYQPIEIDFLETDSKNASIIIDVIPANACVANKPDNGRYYLILCCLLFIPMTLAFVWFNSIVAYDVWHRRKLTTAKVKNANRSMATSSRQQRNGIAVEANSVGAESNTTIDSQASTRETRQLRVFLVLSLLVVTYLVLNMPDLIFLVMSFYNLYDPTTVNAWLLEYVFGIMAYANLAINPFLYAFVTQTMDHLLDIYRIMQHYCRICVVRGGKAMSSVIIVPNSDSSTKQQDNL